MNRTLLLIFVSLITFSSCKEKTPQEQKTITKPEKKAEMATEIKNLEDEIFNTDNSVKDIQNHKEAAGKLVNLYTNYYNLYPEDPKGGDYLFKAGIISLGLGKARQAIKAFRNSHDAFPGYKKRVEAVYMVAFIYDDELNKKDDARHYYSFVVENYPEHVLAKDAEARLNTLEMTDQELIEFFEKKNAKK